MIFLNPINVPDTYEYITNGDKIRIGRFSHTEWTVHYGWYSFGGNRPICGWYLTSEDYNGNKPLSKADLEDCYMIETVSPQIDSLVIPGSTTQLPINSIVELADVPDKHWVLQFGEYPISGNTYIESSVGWYFKSIPEQQIRAVNEQDLRNLTIISYGFSCSSSAACCPVTIVDGLTPEEAQRLHSSFITVESVEAMHALPASVLEDGRIVNIADTDDCYVYDSPTHTWRPIGVISNWETI